MAMPPAKPSRTVARRNAAALSGMIASYLTPVRRIRRYFASEDVFARSSAPGHALWKSANRILEPSTERLKSSYRESRLPGYEVYRFGRGNRDVTSAAASRRFSGNFKLTSCCSRMVSQDGFRGGGPSCSQVPPVDGYVTKQQ